MGDATMIYRDLAKLGLKWERAAMQMRSVGEHLDDAQREINDQVADTYAECAAEIRHLLSPS